MGFLFRLLSSLAVAILLGFGVSYYALTDGRLFGAVRVGPWAAWPEVGQPSPDPYSRAFLARSGILQLGYAEGVQFTATNDSSGEPLERTCTYVLSGATPGATFWTMVAIDPDGANIAAPDTNLALHSERLARTGDGSVRIIVGPDLAPLNWLEIDGAGPFTLALTLYDATIFSGAATTVSAMPDITKVACS